MIAKNVKWAIVTIFHTIGQQADFAVCLFFCWRPFVLGDRLIFHDVLLSFVIV
jgi:hypothetical protein